jgi:tetratricopeptide (TPR) repeat protein
MMLAVPAFSQARLWGRPSLEQMWLKGAFAETEKMFAFDREHASTPSLDLWQGEFEIERGNYREANALLLRFDARAQGSGADVAARWLARLRLAQGELQDAEKRALKGVKWDGTRVEKLRINNPHQLLTLGEIYYARGRYVEANALFQKSVLAAGKVWASQRVYAMIGQARVKLALNDAAGAAARAQEAEDAAKKEWDRGSIPVLEALDTLGMSHLANGEFADAEYLVSLVLQARVGIYGQTHVKVAQSYLHLARISAARGQTGKAIALADRALKTYHEIFTGLNVWSALALVESADVYEAAGNHQDAQRQYRESLTVLDRFLGADTPTVQRVRALLKP